MVLLTFKWTYKKKINFINFKNNETLKESKRNFKKLINSIYLKGLSKKKVHYKKFNIPETSELILIGFSFSE